MSKQREYKPEPVRKYVKRHGMVETRFFTLDEWALDAMCSQREVRLDSGAVGVIREIYVSIQDPDVRRIGVLETVGRRMHHLDLTHGAVSDA